MGYRVKIAPVRKKWWGGGESAERFRCLLDKGGRKGHSERRMTSGMKRPLGKRENHQDLKDVKTNSRGLGRGPTSASCTPGFYSKSGPKAGQGRNRPASN